MRRGTTPIHTFTVDRDLTSATVLFITYKQNNVNKVEKDIGACTITTTSVQVQLTQEETLSFEDEGTVFIQIRAGFADGTRIASNIIKTAIEAVLKDGEI